MANIDGHYGLAQQSTLVNQIRAEAKLSNSHVLLLSAGDINTGAPESNIFNAEPDIKAMNKIGYDAMAIGNHEFDKPQSVLREQQKLAKFEFVNANIKTTDGKHAFRPYITRI
ncbi:MAG: metallophosphoesterase, partial [Bdellovibrionales bacterium]|nr:metallophosphoesterase [Bdellovibrionales bacterium]